MILETPKGDDLVTADDETSHGYERSWTAPAESADRECRTTRHRSSGSSASRADPSNTRNFRQERPVTSPRISRVHPLAGVEGGRVTIFGEDLCTWIWPVAPQFDTAGSRPLIAAPGKMIVPIPEGAASGFLGSPGPTVSSRTVLRGGREAGGRAPPRRQPVVDGEGRVITTSVAAEARPAHRGVGISDFGGRRRRTVYQRLLNPPRWPWTPRDTVHLLPERRHHSQAHRPGRPRYSPTDWNRHGIAFSATEPSRRRRAGGIYAVEPQARSVVSPSCRPAWRPTLGFGPTATCTSCPTLSNDDPSSRSADGRSRATLSIWPDRRAWL